MFAQSEAPTVGKVLFTPEALWVPSTPAEMGDSTSSSSSSSSPFKELVLLLFW